MLKKLNEQIQKILNEELDVTIPLDFEYKEEEGEGEVTDDDKCLIVYDFEDNCFKVSGDIVSGYGSTLQEALEDAFEDCSNYDGDMYQGVKVYTDMNVDSIKKFNNIVKQGNPDELELFEDLGALYVEWLEQEYDDDDEW